MVKIKKRKKKIDTILERRKQQFISILKQLQIDKLISSFKILEKEKSTDTYMFYIIYVSDSIYGKFVFDFQGNLQKEKIPYPHRFLFISILPGEFFDRVKKKIVQNIILLKKGYENAIIRESRVQKILQDEKKRKHSLISFVSKGKEMSDFVGKDMYIGYRNDRQRQCMVPLQIKSSVKYQDIHKHKYPLIPSIVIKDEMTDEEILKNVLEICASYIAFPKRIIVHK